MVGAHSVRPVDRAALKLPCGAGFSPRFGRGAVTGARAKARATRGLPAADVTWPGAHAVRPYRIAHIIDVPRAPRVPFARPMAIFRTIFVFSLLSVLKYVSKLFY